MELTRRDFVVLAATTAAWGVAASVHAPALAFAEPAPDAPEPRGEEAWDELPLQGFAGECSGRH